MRRSDAFPKGLSTKTADALLRVPPASPARAEIEQAVALMATLRHEFEVNDWFDIAMFARRINPLLGEAGRLLQAIQAKDPHFDSTALRATLWRYARIHLQNQKSV